MSPPPLLQVQGLSVVADGTMLLRALDLQLDCGELVGVIGPNGAGKSTLLRCLAGIETPTAGVLLLDAQPLQAVSLEQRARAIAWLEQRPQLHWPLRVEQAVALGRLPWRDLPQVQPTATLVQRALERCDLLKLRAREFHSLSEGEKLLVNLARVLVVEARLLLADEPTAALDPCQQLRVMELLQQEAQGGKAVVAVLHDLTLAARYCSRLILLHKGEVVAAGTPETVLTPQHLAAVYGISGAFDPALRTLIINGSTQDPT
jgi:iron complex transport system ATP-binding protein